MPLASEILSISSQKSLLHHTVGSLEFHCFACKPLRDLKSFVCSTPFLFVKNYFLLSLMKLQHCKTCVRN